MRAFKLCQAQSKDKKADDILNIKVCEPAMGSAAFLNEAINQLSEEYLLRKQEELGESIDHDNYYIEKQRRDKRKMETAKIERINELYRKSKAEGLTEEEKKEQQILRREYVDAFKRNLRGQLNNISIKEKDGSITNLGEKYGQKKGN